jgi:diguanylate cyclase (GGDEF)-like protein/PAS domain S-box-containing protein
MKILIVEDTDDSRTLLEDMLRANGREVDSAVNGVQALQMATKAPPDLIISDILMPEMDGYEFCRLIKRDPQLQLIPFIFYTATYTDSRDEQLALSLGASRFIIKPEDPAKLLEIINQVWSAHINAEGEQALVEKVVSDTAFEPLHAEVLNRKLSTKLLELEKQGEELELAALVFQSSSEGMMVTDANNRIITVNPAFSAITGYSFDEVKGKPPSILSSGHHEPSFYQAMWQQLKNTGKWHGEVWDKLKDGEVCPRRLTINTIRDNDGLAHRYVAIFSDITEKKQSEELIWRQANFDSLTGLPNRNMFRSCLELELKKSKRAELRLALLLIDLDLFKEVNDTLGHDIGDILLQQATGRINECVRESDVVARLGGDEFIVILPEISETGHVEDIADKLLVQLAEPYSIGNEVVYVSASIGITLYPNDATAIESLLKNADQAMYVAKKKGRNRFSYFTPALQIAAQTRLRLSNDLRGALAAGQFRIHFQPIIELTTGRICKAEALIRWQHPERGLVSPMDFIPLAEETGLMNAIGDWVFKESARQAKRLSKQFHCDCQISVNMSPVQFRVESQNFAKEWLQYLQELGLSGENFVIEITEGLLLNAESDITDKLLALRDAGIQVAIDDFGTGYSALSYLKKFDIDYLKIDQSFVRNIETDMDDVALSEAIIVMAHKLGLKVIAEGVETQGQKEILTEAGCDYAQGYLYSKPMPSEEFEALLLHEQAKK